MSQESLLLREIHRTCESCGAVAERNDQLHLCGCAEQMNCCADCSAKCAADSHCGFWFFKEYEGARFPLLYFEAPG